MSFIESREIFDLFLVDYYPDFAHSISDEALGIENEKLAKADVKVAACDIPLFNQEAAIATPLLNEDCPVMETKLLDSPGDEQGSSILENNISYSDPLQAAKAAEAEAIEDSATIETGESQIIH